MSGIPVQVQRSFEQRWAAKLASSGASARPKAIDLKRTVNSLPRPATAKETNDNQLAWPFILISGGLVRRLSCLAARVLFNALALVLREVPDGKCKGTCRARSHVRGASRKSDRSDIRQHYREMAALSIAVSRTPGRSIRMRVGGPSGSLFKRQVGLGSRPFAYHPPPGRARAKGQVEIARARDLSRYPRPISAAFAAGPLHRRSR